MATAKVTLLFTAADVSEGHYEVLSYPKSEMEGSTTEALADEIN